MNIIRTYCFLLLVAPAYQAAEAQSEFCFGDCRGAIIDNFQDVNINQVQVREDYRRRWRTSLMIGRRDLRTFISGQYGANVEAFLYDISQQGYYTVNLTTFGFGGWYIQGNRNAEREREARELARQRAFEAQRREETRQMQQRAQENASRSEGGKKSSTARSAARTCEVYLYSDMNRSDYRLESYITVSGEHMEVTWGNTGVNEGEPYNVDVHIENRSGNDRILKTGSNWVDPGRYRIFLRFSGIRFTSVTIKYSCD